MQEYLLLVEFAYKNGYQESLRMSLFKELYGLSCKTSINCSDPVNIVLIGLDKLVEMEHEIQVIEVLSHGVLSWILFFVFLISL